MKIILNSLQFKKQSSGIGILIFNLFGTLINIKNHDDGIDLLLSKDSPEMLIADRKNVVQCRTPFDKKQAVLRNIFENFCLGNKYCKNGVFVSADSKLPLLMPRKCKKLLIVADLAVYRMGEVYQFSRTLFWRFMFKHSIRKADKVIAISQFTKDEIVDILNVEREKIEVVYCAANNNYKRVEDDNEKRKVREKYNLPDKYILFVGNFNPRKNLKNIIKAYEKCKVDFNLVHDLVIVGENGWKFDREKTLKDIKVKENILFPGYAAEENMPAIYSMADLFVFPTLYEGFGIPVIESQQCGTPVLASNTSCFEEIGGEGAAVYVNPYSSDEIAEGIYKILSDEELRRRLVHNGYKNASRFSWEISARKLYSIISGLSKG